MQTLNLPCTTIAQPDEIGITEASQGNRHEICHDEFGLSLRSSSSHRGRRGASLGINALPATSVVTGVVASPRDAFSPFRRPRPTLGAAALGRRSQSPQSPPHLRSVTRPEDFLSLVVRERRKKKVRGHIPSKKKICCVEWEGKLHPCLERAPDRLPTCVVPDFGSIDVDAFVITTVSLCRAIPRLFSFFLRERFSHGLDCNPEEKDRHPNKIMCMQFLAGR